MPALGLVFTSIHGKMYTKNLEIFGNNQRARFVKLSMAGPVSFSFTSTIYSRKAISSDGVRDIKVDVVVTFCWITLSSCFARVFIPRATNFNYMLLSFNIISKSCSFVLFSCQIKKL